MVAVTEKQLLEIRAMVDTGFIPAPGDETVVLLLEYVDQLKTTLCKSQQKLNDEVAETATWHDLYLRAIHECDESLILSVLSSFIRPIVEAALHKEQICSKEILALAFEHHLIEPDPDYLDGRYLFTEVLTKKEVTS